MASVNLQEKANFTRLSRLLVNKGTEALRITLDAIHAPVNLPVVLNANKATLIRLKPRVINDTQWDLLFPPSGNPPDSKTFDVTLLTILLRNISGFPPPATGWNTMPPDTDNSIQANITRIKLFRNQVYAHVTSTQVDKSTFDDLWLKISNALIDLKIPTKEIDELKACPLGPKEEFYKQSLTEWFLKDEECKDKIDNLTRYVKQSVQNMKHLTQIVEQSHQGIQQLCASSSKESELSKPMPDSKRKIDDKHCTSKHEQLSKPMSDSKKRKIDDNCSTYMDEQLLQKLAKHNFKSKIERKVNFFHPGTREWLLKQIYNWFELEDESKLLLLTAGPGFGKSVFAAKVCKIFEEKGKLAACHFCDFSNSNLKDPRKMLQSLASHMCQNISGFRKSLLDQLKRPYDVLSLKDAFQIYLQNPLDELGTLLNEEERSLIVIDGLDESATDDKSDMVKLIADNFPDLPKCVKVLVTSRPELSIQGLDDVEKIKIDVEDVDNESDILKYLSSCLPKSRLKILPQVAKKCEGSFLYAFHVQRELLKREDLDTATFEEIMAFLPKGMRAVFQEYFHRLEKELEPLMKGNPGYFFKILELLVGIDTTTGELPLKFIARALHLDLDCRKTRKIINKVNDAVSCLLYVSDDLITIFHKSVHDWLIADGYEEHEYTVKVSDGKAQLWLICEQVFGEVKDVVSSGKDLKLTNEVKHSLEHGHEYLLACDTKELYNFSWLVDMIIVFVILDKDPRGRYYLYGILKKSCRENGPILSIQLRQRISWHRAEMGFLVRHSFQISSNCNASISYLESVVKNSPQGCFADNERNIAELILTKSPRCVKRISVGMKSLNPLFTIIFPCPIVAVGVSSNMTLAAVALEDGTICVLSLPKLVTLWQYSTENYSISCCIFAPDDKYILYGKLEKVIDIELREEVRFFNGEVEKFKSCAFSPNGKRLLTTDGSNELKLWDVVRRSLVAVLSTGTPVDRCRFTSTGLFIVGGTSFTEENTYSVWNSITLQRVDQRTRFSGNEHGNKDGILRSKRCNRCFRKECKELIPSNGLGILPSMLSDRYNKLSAGIYKEVDCFFYLTREESLRIIESIHFKMIEAWEMFVAWPRLGSLFDNAAIKDDQWLYSDDQQLVVFNSVPHNDNQPNLPYPTSVLWCSFSPDGTRLATCTSDGFLNLWNVDTSQVHQRFRSGRETSSAACWWSDKYLLISDVTDAIPSLSRYPVDESLKMVINERQLMPLCSVKDAFLPFSKFLDFSEGYLSFECGRTEPVKVLDVTKVGHPHPIMLPEIKPKMSIAVSSRALFVLAAGEGQYFLWKRKETEPTVYYLFVKFENLQKTPIEGLPDVEFCRQPYHCKCCFSSDSKFAIVSLVSKYLKKCFLIIDVDSGKPTTLDIDGSWVHNYFFGEIKMFCTDTFMIFLASNLIAIVDFKKGKRLDLSHQPYITRDVRFHSKLSPKGTVLAVPRITGDMEFFELRIPKQSLASDGGGGLGNLTGRWC